MAEPFVFLKDAPTETLVRLVAGESPLLAAVVMVHLPPATAAKVLANLSDDQQRAVVEKMGKARSAPPDVVAKVAVGVKQRLEAAEGASEERGPSAGSPPVGGDQGERALPQAPRRVGIGGSWMPRRADESQRAVNETEEDARRRKAMEMAMERIKKGPRSAPAAKAGKAPKATPDPEGRKVDGLALAAEILRLAPASVRKNVSSHDPRLFERLRERMFTFDDLERSPDATVGKVFSEVDPATAGLALRFASPDLQRRALALVSARRAEVIRSEIELSAQGRVRVGDIEAAQGEVMETAKRLQAAGQVLIDPDDPDLVGPSS